LTTPPPPARSRPAPLAHRNSGGATFPWPAAAAGPDPDADLLEALREAVASGRTTPVRALKSAPGKEVHLVRWEGRELVLKRYRHPRALLWRTALAPSRAAREFANLRRLVERGVPCVRPLAWGERRVLGCTTTSWIATAYAGSSETVDHRMFGLPPRPGEDARRRRAVASRAGRLVRRLHEAGTIACTLHPRNVIVTGAGERARLLLIDLPHAQHFARDVVATRRALIDLYDLGWSSGARRLWNAAEQRALLAAYARGDRAVARDLGRRLDRRGSRRQAVQRELLKLISSTARSVVWRETRMHRDAIETR